MNNLQEIEENIIINTQDLLDDLYNIGSYRQLNQDEHKLITALQDFLNSFND